MEAKWLVAWDFPARPKRLFYTIAKDEFGPDEVEWLQQSVVLCRDDFTARRLRALARWYGAEIIAYAVAGQCLDDPQADGEAMVFVDRVHRQRRARRGRRGSR